MTSWGLSLAVGSVVSILITISHSLHNDGLHLLFSHRSLLASPADRHMFIHGLPAEIRHAEHCVKILPKDLHRTAHGSAHRMPLNFCTVTPPPTHTQAVASPMTQPLPAHVSTSGGSNSYSAGSAQRTRFSFTISVPEAYGLESETLNVKQCNPRVFRRHLTAVFATFKVSS